jgi:hypothetical protein
MFNSGITNKWKVFLETDGIETTNLNNFYGCVQDSNDGDWFRESDQSLLPLSIKIAAKTIGIDLVSVQPMSAPIGNIFAYNIISRNEIIRRRKEKISKLK